MGGGWMQDVCTPIYLFGDEDPVELRLEEAVDEALGVRALFLKMYFVCVCV